MNEGGQVLKQIVFTVVLSLVCCAAVSAQVAPSAYRRSSALSVGGTISAFRPYPNAGSLLPGYPRNSLLGVGAFVDFNVSRWWGIEAEGRWLRIHQTDQIHEDTYLAGPRILVPWHRVKFYGKGLYGVGEFAFPYGYAHEQAPVLALGGGVDLRLTRRLSVRALDGEYQKWRNFQNHGISPFGASAGLVYRVF